MMADMSNVVEGALGLGNRVANAMEAEYMNDGFSVFEQI